MRETRNKSKSKGKGKRKEKFVLTLILNNALLLILLYFISLATPNEWTGRRRLLLCKATCDTKAEGTGRKGGEEKRLNTKNPTA